MRLSFLRCLALLAFAVAAAPAAADDLGNRPIDYIIEARATGIVDVTPGRGVLANIDDTFAFRWRAFDGPSAYFGWSTRSDPGTAFELVTLLPVHCVRSGYDHFRLYSVEPSGDSLRLQGKRKFLDLWCDGKGKAVTKTRPVMEEILIPHPLLLELTPVDRTTEEQFHLEPDGRTAIYTTQGWTFTYARIPQ